MIPVYARGNLFVPAAHMKDRLIIATLVGVGFLAALGIAIVGADLLPHATGPRRTARARGRCDPRT